MNDTQNLPGIETLPELDETNVIEEPVADASLEEAAPVEQPEPMVAKQQPKSKQDHPNFASLRSGLQKAERERDDLARRLQEKEAEYEVDLAPDELAEGRHLSKVTKKIKNLEDQIKTYEQKTYQISVQNQLKSQYADFDTVVNGETIAQLSQSYPELANTLNSSQDLYSTGVSAYTMIKQLGISPNSQLSQDRQRAIANAAKPRPLVSGSHASGASPLSAPNAFANGLTEDLRSQLIREMVEAQKNL